jgi:nitrate reductase gamma subunit
MIQVLFYVSGTICIVILTFTGLVLFEWLARNLHRQIRASHREHDTAATLRLIFISLGGAGETSNGGVASYVLELKTVSVYDYLTNSPLQAEVDLALAEFLFYRPGFKAREPQS